jgi:hypothetical protein
MKATTLATLITTDPRGEEENAIVDDYVVMRRKRVLYNFVSERGANFLIKKESTEKIFLCTDMILSLRNTDDESIHSSLLAEMRLIFLGEKKFRGLVVRLDLVPVRVGLFDILVAGDRYE